MKRHYLLIVGISLMVGAMSQPTMAQVSNDNEDEVYKLDERARANDFVPGQVLVKFKDESSISVRHNAKGKFQSASISPVDKLLRDYGVDDMEKLFPAEIAKPKAQLRKKAAPNGTIVQERNLDKVFWIKTSVQSVDSTLQLIESLKEMEEVEYAEPNYRVYITADGFEGSANTPKRQAKNIRLAPVYTETDASVICANPSQNPLYSQQYGITQQNIHQLWDKPIINKKRPVIAILDSGVDIEHPDLKNNIWQNAKEVEGEMAYDDDNNGIVDDKYGWNFVDDYYDVTDNNGHGTHVAGIAAAADNSIGVVGANPLALIMPVKVMTDRGEGDHATIARGIIYAANNGADIINMSIGGPQLSSVLKNALDNAYQTSIIIASAGNEGKNIYSEKGCMYPAAYYLVLGVEASTSAKVRAGFSNYDPDGPIYSEDGADGRNYEVQVPGKNIYSTLPGGKYSILSGTSMSAPLFAGSVSALLMVKEYPSKEVLFGDLIHLKADFAKIYSDETPRYPCLDLITMTIDDNVGGNTNIDGQLDVGETIRFIPLLRNTWADATDIQIKLSVDPLYASFVEIQNPEMDFGYSLSAYGRMEAKTPFMVKFSNNIGDYTRMKFIFEASTPHSSETLSQEFYVTIHNMVKISGLITEDRTLTADYVYYVTEDIGVNEGVTLTIEPGTRMEFSYGKKLVSFGKLVAKGSPEKPIVFTGYRDNSWGGVLCTPTHAEWIDHTQYYYPRDTISYCIINQAGDYWKQSSDYRPPYMLDCLVTDNSQIQLARFSGERNNFVNMNVTAGGWNASLIPQEFSNIVNCGMWGYGFKYSALRAINLFNTIFEDDGHCLEIDSTEPYVDKAEKPSYLGTGREDFVRPHIREIGFGTIDLSNMPNRPYAEAHGIVWKVVVNGKDAQDEFDELPPLGVGKHKFEVYFNRPMNKAVAPKISFGVREPYTQHAVDEDAGWNEDGTIYTAYFTITGKTASDGLNSIYVQGAEDNEFFECPFEKDRFKIIIQTAGSMATGFAAEAGLGCVSLTWNNENNDFEDAMGFNIYRHGESYEKLIYRGHYGNDGRWYSQDTIMVADTIRLNQEIVDLETTAFTDYEVKPGETYYYYYKVLSTDLTEYDVSNVVAATPLTATLGDANGSGKVDVADVITTVNYASGQKPHPFIFEAADMNTDQLINILDIIGIIKAIINTNAATTASVEATATYTVEDGILYVESPVALAGVQVQLSNSQFTNDNSQYTVASDLDGFEHTSAWLSENDYIFLAYNMNGKTLNPGKHALLHIGNGNIAQICLSDAVGHNVQAIGDDATKVNRMASDVMNVPGIYDLQGRKLTGDSSMEVKLPKGVYIINGRKVVR